MVPALVAPPPAQPTRGRGQAVRGGGQAVRGEGQAVRGGGQPTRSCPKDIVQSDGGRPRCYAFPTRPEAELSDVVITGIVPICHRYTLVLFDPGSVYSYVSSYFASYQVVPRDSLSALVYVSMPVGDYIIVDRVYHSCVITIGCLETSIDLLLLDMVYFDVILSMDWLSLYHVVLDCHAKMVIVVMPRLPRLEWRETLGHSISRIISYVKARRMVEKRCLAYLAYVRDSSVEVPSMDFLPVVCEFPEVFPVDQVDTFHSSGSYIFFRAIS
ncbi:uncharacterized protein [Nicotiana tomentosiformis]|uniref:uncharacterized protein n=1 Tax=Nicotiana tomentosiformis TaxID=4098 RepID=UPI00388CB5E7